MYNSLVRRILKLDLQTRLVVGFMIATGLTGLIATTIAIWTINRSTIEEVQNRVRQDIHTAKLIYQNTMERISFLVQLTAQDSDLCQNIRKQHTLNAQNLRNLIRPDPQSTIQYDGALLDMLTLVNKRGNVVLRVTNPDVKGDSLLRDPLVRACMETKTPQSSTELMPLDAVLRENPELSERVRIQIIKTPLSFETEERELDHAMVMRVAHPIFDKKRNFLGVLVGGLLINKDYTIVDKIRDTIYRGERYKGREMGVATIFQGGVRISTNVMTKQGKRAVGTTLSKEVYDRVIIHGADWVGRAFVVDDWYITTYTPIHDLMHNTVGILYVGILEAKYRDIKWKTIWTNLGIIGIGMLVAFAISFQLGNTIITRIRLLKEAAEAIASGDLDRKLSPDKISGFDMLDEAFNYMSSSLKDRERKLQSVYQQLARTEKLTALGEMAAGVAHEINNPLGGILLYSNLLLEDLPEDSPLRANVQKIIDQTNRCKKIVNNLLDFARTPTGELQPLQLNSVLTTSLNLVKDQSMFHGIEIETNFEKNLPEVMGDRSRLEEVFLNLYINAADAMEGKGKLIVKTTRDSDHSIKVTISDTGKGIHKEHLPHIFEPFFTTKAPGQGTGLGLSIAYGIIQKHNGTIEVESKPGKGTTFTITLPVHKSIYTEVDEDIFYS